MKFIKICILYSVLVISACNNPQTSQVESSDSIENTSTNKNVPQRDDYAEKQAALKLFDNLEHLFDNQNYLSVIGKDSQYAYFSRIGKFQLFTYHYNIVHGDSANLNIDTILLNSNNQVVWAHNRQLWQLKQATPYTAEWENMNDAKQIMHIKSINRQKLSQTISNQSALTYQKTIPLSTFLVRIRYDHLHGTHFAFDTTNFTKKHK